MAQTMNMVETEREQSRPFRIAELTGLRKNPLDEGMLFPEQRPSEISVSWEDDRAILSTLIWDRSSWRVRLALIETALAAFDCILDAPAARLQWCFSSRYVDRSNAGDLLSQWIDQGAPPVMEFIDFSIVALNDGRLIRTRGLAAIFGYELDAIIFGSNDQHLGKMVAHLAQDLLLNGPLTSMEAVGPDNQKYRLTIVPGNASVDQTIRITSA